MDKRPIGVFDSGVGGLTVLREIIRQVPNEDFIYFGDTARFPYGTKNLADVKNYAIKIAQFLVNKKVKLLVVACNTASAAALETLRQSFSIPVTGVIEPGARAALKFTRTKKIGVIATDSTVSSQSYDKAVNKINPDVRLLSVAASPLVEFIEKGILGGDDLKEKIRNYIAPLVKESIDVLILGCTHFPLIRSQISRCCNADLALSGRVRVISSALETAKDVKKILTEKYLKNSPDNRSSKIFFETGNDSKFLEIGRLFLGDKIREVIKIDPGTM